jgi:hypothetical protein
VQIRLDEGERAGRRASDVSVRDFAGLSYALNLTPELDPELDSMLKFDLVLSVPNPKNLPPSPVISDGPMM